MILHDLAFLVEPAWHGAQAGELAARTRAAAARSELVVVPSPLVAAQAERLLPEARGKVAVVPWGGDHVPAPEKPGRPDPEAPLFVAVGTVEPRKDHATLLDAFAAVRRGRPRARLVVAGLPGWADPAVRARLARLHRDPASGVRWERRLPDADLFPLLARATALVYPSRYEGFGLPVAEALHLGVPPIVAAGTAAAWVAGAAGIAVPPGDSLSLAAAMSELAGEPRTREDLQDRGRERSVLFRWDRAADLLAQLLARLA